MENREISMRRKQFFTIFVMILLAALTRFLPHLPNLTPIGAIALFSGAKLKGINRYLLPLIIMLLTDAIIGFHNTMVFVYGSFLIITLLGAILQSKTTYLRIFGSALFASIIFFLITNFGVWLVGPMYPKTIAGLSQAYFMGIPFFRNTLIGDLIYVPVLFYGYSFISNKIMKLRNNYA